ncbi:cupin domain-containing protein [Caulobacter sp. S45]|uniref:cupin domain-containing protein n=1 Tax=Caulobacter sp. S45 TaxID=1641861 RepID=UPI00131E6AA8|nr:cupin domain-containing protein [Caulobacter sp. S45]
MEPIDWLSRLLVMMPVSGRAEHRCFFGAPWRLENPPSDAGEVPYHIVLAGSAVLDGVEGAPSRRLKAGDILLLTHGPAHILHDGGGQEPSPNRQRFGPILTIDENDGDGERLDMLCGRFIFSPAHERLVHDYLPARLVVSAAEHSAGTARPGARAQLASLVGLMRSESAEENLGGRAMLAALSTAMFTLTLRLASEDVEAPSGLLALAGHPRLAPALTAIFNEPAKPWTLPELSSLCSMSRATFIRQFQQSLGRSATDLLTDVRMTVAANELGSSSTPTGAVAEAVGYQSEAAFQRTFKQHMGVTPAQYRRQAAASNLHRRGGDVQPPSPAEP